MRSRYLVILAAFWVSVSCGWARDLHVDNVMGDDRNDGSAPEVLGERVGPFRTITRALSAVRKGDRVILANKGEAYRESITLQGGRSSGLHMAPFELIGNGAVLDGTVSVPAFAWTHYRGNIFRFHPLKTSFQILYHDGKPAQRRRVTSSEGIEDLEPLEWCLFERHIYFRVEEGRLPQSYELTYTGLPVGITLYEVHNVVIRDLVIQGFQLDGVNAHDGVQEAVLTGLNCRGNGRSGISVGGASQVVIQACLVGNNGEAQVRTEGASQTHIVACDLLDNTAPKIVRDGGRVVESQD